MREAVKKTSKKDMMTPLLFINILKLLKHVLDCTFLVIFLIIMIGTLYIVLLFEVPFSFSPYSALGLCIALMRCRIG